MSARIHAYVKWLAVLLLAQSGNSSAWDAVFGWLKTQLRRRRPGACPPDLAVALVYLLKEQPVRRERIHALGPPLRQNVERLPRNERNWLVKYWPQVLSVETQELLPSTDELRHWLETPSLWEMPTP